MKQKIDDLKRGSGGHVDSVLTRFFRAEMPHPWPECEASAQAIRTPPSCRSRAMSRFALAASIVLFFLGYFTLSGYFPRDHYSVPVDGSAPFAQRPGKGSPPKNPMKSSEKLP